MSKVQKIHLFSISADDWQEIPFDADDWQEIPFDADDWQGIPFDAYLSMPNYYSPFLQSGDL